jgi:pyruvate-ferredoxin/flavodoxin oxidoreductase
LKQLAGLEIAPAVRDQVATTLEAEFETRSATLRAEYEAKLSDLRTSYPAQMARRLASALLTMAGGSAAVAELLAELPAPPKGAQGAQGAPVTPAAQVAPVAPVAPIAAVATADDDTMVLEAYIDSIRCTTCNECTNINKKLFAYNADKQAFIKDPKAGTFQQLVTAAERCPVAIIHPGTPLNPKEKDLEKWIARAAKFN